MDGGEIPVDVDLGLEGGEHSLGGLLCKRGKREESSMRQFLVFLSLLRWSRKTRRLTAHSGRSKHRSFGLVGSDVGVPEVGGLLNGESSGSSSGRAVGLVGSELATRGDTFSLTGVAGTEKASEGDPRCKRECR